MFSVSLLLLYLFNHFWNRSGDPISLLQLTILSLESRNQTGLWDFQFLFCRPRLIGVADVRPGATFWTSLLLDWEVENGFPLRLPLSRRTLLNRHRGLQGTSVCTRVCAYVWVCVCLLLPLDEESGTVSRQCDTLLEVLPSGPLTLYAGRFLTSTPMHRYRRDGFDRVPLRFLSLLSPSWIP